MTNVVLDIENLVVGLGTDPAGKRIIDGISFRFAKARRCAWSARAGRANL